MAIVAIIFYLLACFQIAPLENFVIFKKNFWTFFWINIDLFNLISFILFVYCGISDFLDGYLSRRWKTTNDFGKIYDPVFDKFIICSFLLLFSIKRIIFWLLPTLLIVRDVIMDIIRVSLSKSKKNIIIPASKIAKYKTISQFLFIFIIFLFFNYVNNDENIIREIMVNLLLIPSLLFSYISFIQYMCNIGKLIKKN